MTAPEVGTYDIEHDQIAEVTFTAVPARGGIECFVKLHDGNIRSFTAYTPAQLERLMDQNGWLSFVDLDTLVVKERSLEAVMHALEQVLLLGIDHFGIRVNEEAVRSLTEDEDPWATL
jgi:hypothetical protein